MQEILYAFLKQCSSSSFEVLLSILVFQVNDKSIPVFKSLTKGAHAVHRMLLIRWKYVHHDITCHSVHLENRQNSYQTYDILFIHLENKDRQNFLIYTLSVSIFLKDVKMCLLCHYYRSIEEVERRNIHLLFFIFQELLFRGHGRFFSWFLGLYVIFLIVKMQGVDMKIFLIPTIQSERSHGFTPTNVVK